MLQRDFLVIPSEVFNFGKPQMFFFINSTDELNFLLSLGNQ